VGALPLTAASQCTALRFPETVGWQNTTARQSHRRSIGLRWRPPPGRILQLQQGHNIW